MTAIIILSAAALLAAAYRFSRRPRPVPGPVTDFDRAIHRAKVRPDV